MKHLAFSNGQFGKNPLADRNQHLPTVHGIEQFFGYLYPLNAQESPNIVTIRRTLIS